MMNHIPTVEDKKDETTQNSVSTIVSNALRLIEKNNVFFHAIREVTSQDPQQEGGKPLSGLTVVVKDNIQVDGFTTHAGLKRALPDGSIREGNLIKRIKDKGAFIVGKAQCAELSIGGTGLNMAQGTPKNPYGKSDHLSPGGSSSGVAVAVATDMAKIGIGTDSGGSIRVPASVCGLAGYRPSDGVFVNDGYLGLGSSDRFGIIAKTMEEIRAFSDEMSELDLSATSSASPKIKYMTQELLGELAPDHLQLYLSRIEKLKGIFSDVTEIDRGYFDDLEQKLGHIHYGKLAGFGLSRLVDQVIPEYEKDLDPRLQLMVKNGRAVTNDEAQNIQERLKKLARIKMVQLYAQTDYLITPSLPISAPRIDLLSDMTVYEHLSEAMLKFTMLGTLLQGPCITFPNGLDAQGIPVGMHVIGKPGTDRELLSQQWEHN